MIPEKIFQYFVNERWQILKRREAEEPKPWTEDEILQNYYFCNVCREDDKVTKFIRQWSRPVWKEKSLMGWLTLARMINWPDTLKEIDPVHKWSGRTVERILKRRRKQDKQIFNGAYLITTCGVKMDKLEYVVDVSSDVVAICKEKDTCDDQWNELVKVNGLGSFLAAQVVADMKNTPDHTLFEASDWWTFCAPGPGSIKGLNYLANRSPSKHMGTSQFYKEIEYAKDLTREIKGLPILSMQDVQNCLCEYSKYMTVLNGGRAKRKYSGISL